MPWTPPPRLPSAGELRQAIEILTVAPTRREHAAFCISKLALAFGEGKLSKEVTMARAEVWLEACGDLGDDLWSKATMALIRSWRRDEHYGRVPEPADFRAAMKLDLEERAKKLDRCRRMLGATQSDQPKTPAPKFVPAAERLRKLLAEQRADTSIPDAHRLFNAANTERALALHEGRAMEPWAADFFNAREPARGQVATVARAVLRDTVRANESAAIGPSAQRCAELARERRMQPPVHDDIPEVA